MAKIQVDFTGVNPFTPIVDMDEGVYGFDIKDAATIHNDKSIKIVLTINEGKYKGVEKWYFRNRDVNSENGRRGLLTDLLACGVDPAKLKGVAPYDEENTWKGKKGHFYFVPGDKTLVKGEEGYYDTIRLLTPDSVASMKARFAVGAVAGAAQASAHGGHAANGATAKAQTAPAVHIEQPVANGSIEDL